MELEPILISRTKKKVSEPGWKDHCLPACTVIPQLMSNPANEDFLLFFGLG
jgi:hypothetical protein